MTRPGKVWLGGLDMTWCGKIRFGRSSLAGHGRRGSVGFGKVRQGLVGHGVVWQSGTGRHGGAGQGEAGLGPVGHGLIRHG
jgi:hypothetical protein